MATYYVNIDAETDGTGTEASPFNLLASAETAADDGDTIYMRGECREQVTFTGYTGLSLLVWPGFTASFRGDRLIDAEDWAKTDAQTNVYEITLASTPYTVVEDWDTSIIAASDETEIARHYGHLAPVADVSTVDSTASSWYHDGSKLYIHTSDSANPGTNEKVYAWGASGNGVVFSGCTKCRCTIGGALYCRFAGSNGYIFRGVDCVDCAYEDATIYDAGYHHCGFAGDSTVSNLIRNVMVAGQNSDGSAVESCIVFAAVGSTDGNRGNRGINLRIHHYILLGTDQNPIKDAVRHVSLISHGDGSNSKVNDVEWRDIRVKGYDNRLVTICTASDCDAPTDAADPDTYSIQLINADCAAQACRISENVAVRRSRFAFNATVLNPAQITIAGALLYESCTFTASLTTDQSRLWELNSGGELTFYSCSFWLGGQATTNRSYVARLAHINTLVRMRQTVIARENSGTMFTGLTTIAASNFDCDDTWVYNIGTNQACIGPTAINTLAEWTTEVDPTLIDDNPDYADAANGNLEGAIGGALHGTRKFDASRLGKRGYNNKVYSGHYGAYQYGPAMRSRLAAGALRYRRF